jgi:hypothetical protein
MSSRYDDLRRMREAKFAARGNSEACDEKSARKRYDKSVTIIPPPISVTPSRPKRGRPKTGKAFTGAERTRGGLMPPI